MVVDISKWPLLVLMEHFNTWISSARSPALWNPEADHRCWADTGTSGMELASGFAVTNPACQGEARRSHQRSH